MLPKKHPEMKERITPEFIRRIPKSDLHLHLDGSLRLKTLIGVERVLDMLSGEQLPRIC